MSIEWTGLEPLFKLVGMKFRNAMVAFGCGILMLLGWATNLVAVPTRVTLRSGDNAYIYLPSRFSAFRPTPVLMALYGVSQYPDMALKVWQPVADRNGYILVCPVGSLGTGYTRAPIDDRDRFMAWADYLGQIYTIDWDRSAIIGFSRGGSYAVETGVYKTGPIKTFVSLFGFFREDISGSNPTVPSGNRFVLVTSQGDETEPAMKRASAFFTANQIAHELRYLPGIYHNYPKDMDQFLKSLFPNSGSGVANRE